MLSPDSAKPSITHHQQMSGMNEPQQVHGYLEEEEEEEHSDVSVMILHMSELLSSFVREDPPEKRAEWAAALAEMRASIDSVGAHEELRFIADFSIMLEDGLQCMAEKCARLEHALKSASPRKHDYVHGRSAAAAGAAPYLKRELHGSKMPSTALAVRRPKKERAMVQLVACDLCTDVLPRPRYANHLRHAHPEEFEKVAKFRCSFCKSALFIKEAAFKAHLETCHVRLEHLSYLRRLPQSEICRLCGEECGTLRKLAEHAAKEHPHCQILSCSGCSALFRHPDALVAHWKTAKEKAQSWAHPRCVDGALGSLVTRMKLVGQILAHAKASGNGNFVYVECMQQKITCLECGIIVEDFKKIYTHVHTRHRRDIQSSLMFGCVGCGSTYRCSQGLREHLLRAEIEKFEPCRSAGVVYWDEKLISKDMRPPEARQAKEELKNNPEAMGDNRPWVTPKEEVVEREESEEKVEEEGEKKEEVVDREEGEEKMEEEQEKKEEEGEKKDEEKEEKEDKMEEEEKTEEKEKEEKEEKEDKKEEEGKMEEDEKEEGEIMEDEEEEKKEEKGKSEEKGEKKEGMWEAEMKDELKMKIKRTPVVDRPIADDSMEIDAGFNSMDDMPSLDNFE